MSVNILLLLIISVIQHEAYAADNDIEIFCSINGKKSMQYVSEKFLSFSIDPAVLLAGVNLSETSLKLAQHLSPAYIRLAGPSTEFVRYVDADYKSSNNNPDDSNFVIITPSMWFGINEWFKMAGLTPVFGINDKDASQELWDSKTILPLLEISNKLNISCYWQLGYDSSNKTEIRYKQDLRIFQQILKEKNEMWKIVGSDISHLRDYMGTLEDLKNTTTSVMWEPSTFETFPQKDKVYRNNRPIVKLWTAVPKSSEPTTFLSALQWAKQTGEAAKFGFDVIFRQPRIYEMFSDSPVYWFSILYKQLMGSNVLETKTTISHPNTMIFAHCTRKQNSFVRRGALTVMIVNHVEESHTVKITFGLTMPDKTMEVQSYIMTSPTLNSTEILLNGHLLTFNMLDRKNPFKPTLRRAKVSSHIPLSLPGYSIGFFVLPGARIPVCIDQEKEPDLLLQEIEDDQNASLSQELAFHIKPKFLSSRNNVLGEITSKIKDELRIDEQYYNSVLETDINNLKQRLKGDIYKGEDILPSTRKLFIERAKFLGKKMKNVKPEKKNNELKENILQRIKIKPHAPYKIQSKHLELTSTELDNVLKNRAEARAAQRNIVFTNGELQELIQKAKKMFSKPRSRRDINDLHLDVPYLKSILTNAKVKVEDKKNYLLDNIRILQEDIQNKIRNVKYHNRFKRDINKDLLEIKVEKNKKAPVSQEAYIKSFQKVEHDDFDDNTSSLDTTTKPSKHNIFYKNAKTVIVNPFYKKIEKPKSIIKPEEFQLSTISEELKDIEDDFPCIHKLFGEHMKNTQDKKLESDSKYELGESLEKKTKTSTLKKSKKIEESPEDEFDYRCKRGLEDVKRLDDYNPKDEFRHSSVRHSSEQQFQLNDQDDLNALIYPLTENELSSGNSRIKRGEITLGNRNKFENMHKNINDLIQTIKSKSKLEDAEKTKHFKLSTFPKKQAGIGKKIDDFIIKPRNTIDTKHTDVFNHLKALKQKINERKNALDIKLRQQKYKTELEEKLKMKSFKEIKPVNLKSRIKSISPKLYEILNKPSQVLSSTHIQGRNGKENGAENSETFTENNGINNTLTNVEEKKIQKRSIINIDKKSYILGEYLPTTQILKPWKPSDILLLNRDLGALRTNKPKPPSDYYIFRRLSRQNGNSIRKRSIISEIDSYENQIDSDFNIIKKKSKVHPKIQNYNDNFILKENRYGKKGKNNNITETTQKNHIWSTSNNTKIPLEGIAIQEPTMLQSLISNLFKIVSKMGQHIEESLKLIKFE